MPKGLTDPQHYQDIADAIRAKNGSAGRYAPAEMAAAIAAIDDVSALSDADESWFPPGRSDSWEHATDARIDELLTAADNGEIDLYKDAGWRIGHTRTVHLSAMAATGVGESHVAQSVEIVLVNRGGYQKADGSGAVQFVWQLKDCLSNGTSSEGGYMNSSDTNSGGWDSCARRTWCNDVFRNALPSYLKSHVKQVKVTAANGSSSTTATSSDYCFLPASKEVFGSARYAHSTAESSLSQWTWYVTSANRVKYAGKNGSAVTWWERSPTSAYGSCFCHVTSDGSAYYDYARGGYGLAPCGCI